MTNYEVWQGVLAEFELKLSKANFRTWFLNTGISEYNDGKITVCVPTQFIKTWLEKKYNSEIVKTIEKVTKKPVKKYLSLPRRHLFWPLPAKLLEF